MPDNKPTSDMTGVVAAVTGGASGIGKAITEAYAALGASVAVIDVQADIAQAHATQLGNGAQAFACDVTDQTAVQQTADAVVAAFGRVDVLVNSAGIVALAPAEDLEAKAWNLTMAVNLTGTFFVSQAFGRHMLKAGKGKILNLASQAATVALDEHVAYCASKAGVLGMSRVMASEWAGRGVTVNTISPTVVLTDLGRKAWDGPKGDAFKQLIPTGRFAEPEEIAAAAVFLASPGADMINGHDLIIDGGYTIR